jgi:hypothetical protein
VGKRADGPRGEGGDARPAGGEGGVGPKMAQGGWREILFVFLFVLIDAMIFVLLKLFLELRKFTGKFQRIFRAQRILQNILGQ